MYTSQEHLVIHEGPDRLDMVVSMIDTKEVTFRCYQGADPVLILCRVTAIELIEDNINDAKIRNTWKLRGYFTGRPSSLGYTYETNIPPFMMEAYYKLADMHSVASGRLIITFPQS